MDLKNRLIKFKLKLQGVILPEDYINEYVRYFEGNFIIKSYNVNMRALIARTAQFYSNNEIDNEDAYQKFLESLTYNEANAIKKPKLDRIIYLSNISGSYVTVDDNGIIIDASEINGIFKNYSNKELESKLVGKDIRHIESLLDKMDISCDSLFYHYLNDYIHLEDNYKKFMNAVIVEMLNSKEYNSVLVYRALELAKRDGLDVSLVAKYGFNLDNMALDTLLYEYDLCGGKKEDICYINWRDALEKNDELMVLSIGDLSKRQVIRRGLYSEKR